MIGLSKKINKMIELGIEIEFKYKNCYIISNPTIDETGSKRVDPVDYYGKAFLNSDWVKVI